MKIHKEGFPIIIYFALGLILINVLLNQFPLPIWLSILLIAASVIFWGFIIYFFRNPERQPPHNPNWIIAPADGKVVVIEETIEKEYLQEPRIQLSIFMSPLDVHVNRNPVSGKMQYIQYHKGKYLVAWHPKSSTENERTTFVIQMPNGLNILLRQIAGAVARRIRWYVEEGQEVTQGQEFGFIKFGSRVDIFLPLNAKIVAELGQQTQAGKTVLAELGE